MKYCKNVLFWTALLAVLVFPAYGRGAGSVQAEEPGERKERVFDYAELFDQEERGLLAEKSGRLAGDMKVEIAVLTVENAQGQESAAVADGFYFGHFSDNADESGFVVLIDMDNRELYLGTYGRVTGILTDEEIERILEDMYEEASGGKYGAAALAGLAGAERYYRTYEEASSFPAKALRWYEVLFALVASGAAAGCVCWGVVRQYGMKDSGGAGDRLAYQAGCRFQFENSSDRLVNTIVTHTVIPRESPGGRGGPGKGSGRTSHSTTHNYNGHQAGGGGRKF